MMERLNFRMDYLNRLGPELLARLVAKNPFSKEEVLLDIEATALSIITGHLEQRYDVDGIFNRKYKDTQSRIKAWAVCIVCFLLHERSNVDELNQELHTEYTACMVLLRAIRDGKEDLHAPQKGGLFPPTLSTEEEIELGFGSSPFDLFDLS